MVWVYYILMLLVGAVGLFINLLGLPGLWLMVGTYALYAWISGWNHYVGWASVITLIVIGVIAEIVEFFAGAAGSAAAGGRKRAAFGAIIGALVGGLTLSVIPVPIISTIVGACLGAFIGATIAELFDREFTHALRVGYGAAKGRLAGIIVKSIIGIAMLIIAAIGGFPI